MGLSGYQDFDEFARLLNAQLTTMRDMLSSTGALPTPLTPAQREAVDRADQHLAAARSLLADVQR